MKRSEKVDAILWDFDGARAVHSYANWMGK